MEVKYKRSPFSGRNYDLAVNVSDKYRPSKRAVLYQPSVIESVKDDYDDDGNLMFIHSDVHALIHEKRLDSIGASAVNSYLQSLFTSAGESVPSGVSDDDLMSYVRSRYIQSPSQLKDYLDRISRDTKNQVEQAVLKIRDSKSKQSKSEKDVES